LKFDKVTPEELKYKIMESGTNVAVLDCSEDDIGARANFGRGNKEHYNNAYD
jgi:hypothetical protein